jgi:hypothetical protein
MWLHVHLGYHDFISGPYVKTSMNIHMFHIQRCSTYNVVGTNFANAANTDLPPTTLYTEV